MEVLLKVVREGLSGEITLIKGPQVRKQAMSYLRGRHAARQRKQYVQRPSGSNALS